MHAQLPLVIRNGDPDKGYPGFHSRKPHRN